MKKFSIKDEKLKEKVEEKIRLINKINNQNKNFEDGIIILDIHKTFLDIIKENQN